MNNLQNQNLNQISIMNQKYYKKQIAVLEKHKLVYVPVYLAYTYDDELGKFKKGKPQGLGAYANMSTLWIWKTQRSLCDDGWKLRRSNFGRHWQL